MLSALLKNVLSLRLQNTTVQNDKILSAESELPFSLLLLFMVCVSLLILLSVLGVLVVVMVTDVLARGDVDEEDDVGGFGDVVDRVCEETCDEVGAAVRD